MKTQRILMVAVAAAVALIGVAGVGATGRLLAKPSAIGAVNVERVFDSLNAKVEYEAELSAAQERVKEQLEAKQAAAEKIRTDLDLLAPGTRDYEAKERELKLAALDLRVWSQFEQSELTAQAGIQYESLYRQMLDTIARLCEEQGIDAVFYQDPEPNFRYENLQQLSLLIQARKLLYAAESVDLTDQVIQRMNNEYENAP